MLQTIKCGWYELDILVTVVASLVQKWPQKLSQSISGGGRHAPDVARWLQSCAPSLKSQVPSATYYSAFPVKPSPGKQLLGRFCLKHKQSCPNRF